MKLVRLLLAALCLTFLAAMPALAGSFSVTYSIVAGFSREMPSAPVAPTAIGTITVSGSATRFTPSATTGTLSPSLVQITVTAANLLGSIFPPGSGWQGTLTGFGSGFFQGATASGFNATTGTFQITFASGGPSLFPRLGLTSPINFAGMSYGSLTGNFSAFNTGFATGCAVRTGPGTPVTGCNSLPFSPSLAPSSWVGIAVAGQEISRSLDIDGVGVPEPGTAALMAAGLAGLLFAGRRSLRS